jgi:Mg2+ and Co2+ transporter CorA
LDWDGVGTFAMFIASGAVGVAMVALGAYKAKLASKLEYARLQRERAAPDEGVQEQIRDLEDQVQRLAERLDFTEKLLGSGSKDAAASD